MNQLAIANHNDVANFTPPQLRLIRNTVAKDLNPDEFDVFINIARGNGLNPFKKQIYALVYNKDNPDKRTVSYITGIGGYRAIAQRAGDYRPAEESAVIVTDDNLKDPKRNPLGIDYAEVTVFKFGPDRQWHPIKGRAYWEELAPLKEIWVPDETGRRRPTGDFELDTRSSWGRMPRVMIAKCAEADALRKGWPEDLGALYVDAEMDKSSVIDLSASEIVEEVDKEDRLKAVGGPGLLLTFEFSEGVQNVPYGQVVDRCVEFIEQCEDAGQIEGWKEHNRHALQQFWASHKADALGLSEAMTKRIQALKENA